MILFNVLMSLLEWLKKITMKISLKGIKLYIIWAKSLFDGYLIERLI